MGNLLILKLKREEILLGSNSMRMANKIDDNNL
jgi:hypothetical protein